MYDEKILGDSRIMNGGRVTIPNKIEKTEHNKWRFLDLIDE